MVVTDILTKFNRKKKAWLSPKHPLFLLDTDQKIIYCAGIFSQAVLNKSASTLGNFELERLMVKGLGLTSKENIQSISNIRCIFGQKDNSTNNMTFNGNYKRIYQFLL